MHRLLPLLLLVLTVPARAATDDAERIAGLLEGEPHVRIIRRIDQGVVLGTEDEHGQITGELRIATSAAPDEFPRVTTPSFYVTVESHIPKPGIIERLVHLAGIVVAKDHGQLGFVRQPITPPPLPWDLLWQALGVALAALAAGLIRRGRITWEVKLPHLLPAALQLTIFAYWALYWPGVGSILKAALLQIVLAYAWDAFFSLALFKAWKVGVGPVPIILSANLFAWFNSLGTSVLILVAIASRALIRRKGRHLLNPSATGLSVVLILTLVLPDSFNHNGPFTAFTQAPNLGEVILLLALIPQLRFRIVLASIGAFAGVMLAGVAYPYMPGIVQPGLLLMLTLFLTDPATMPRSATGQVLFGFVVGVNVALVTAVGYALHLPDERLNKVLPVVMGNLLVPALDALGEKIGTFRLPLHSPRWNFGLVALWLLLMVPQFGDTKRWTFNEARHWSYGPSLVVRDADDVPRCEHNPIFCEPFTFRQEAAAWLAKLR